MNTKISMNDVRKIADGSAGIYFLPAEQYEDEYDKLDATDVAIDLYDDIVAEAEDKEVPVGVMIRLINQEYRADRFRRIMDHIRGIF